MGLVVVDSDDEVERKNDKISPLCYPTRLAVVDCDPLFRAEEDPIRLDVFDRDNAVGKRDRSG